MNELLRNLLKLQAIQFGESNEKETEGVVAELRTKVPAQILGHYDRLVARGKKGVAVVRNQVCTGCHMHVPIGVITTLMHGQDIRLCDSCGRYLCLPDEPQAEAPGAVAEVKPVAKPARKRKAVANVS